MLQRLKGNSADDMNIDPYCNMDQPLSFTSHRRETTAKPPRIATLPRGITIPRNLFTPRGSMDTIDTNQKTFTSSTTFTFGNSQSRLTSPRRWNTFNIASPRRKQNMHQFDKDTEEQDTSEIDRDKKEINVNDFNDSLVEDESDTDIGTNINTGQQGNKKSSVASSFQSLRSPRFPRMKSRMRRLIGMSKDLEDMNER